MISIEDALTCVRAQARPLGTQSVPLLRALGRTLAQTVQADRDYPPFDRVTMDGYALRSADLSSGEAVPELRLAGAVYAGQQLRTPVAPGTCVRIMTGAGLPAGADAVAKQEDTVAAGENIRFASQTIVPGTNVSVRGEDAVTGSHLLASGSACTPPVIGLLATVGIATVQVACPPRTTILITGDEVVPVGKAVGPVQIRASNAYMLSAFLAPYGVEPHLVFLKDVRTDIVAAIREAGAGELLLLSGGVSVGDRDFVPEALREAGAQILFHGVDIKPGKPVLFGRLGGSVVFGLPGNPFSVQVAFRIFVDEWLRASLGMDRRATLRLPVHSARTKRGARPEFFGAVFRQANGRTSVEALSHNGSGDVTAGVGSDGLALHPGDVSSLGAGDVVEFFPW